MCVSFISNLKYDCLRILRIYYCLFLFWHLINLYGFSTAGDFCFRNQEVCKKSDYLCSCEPQGTSIISSFVMKPRQRVITMQKIASDSRIMKYDNFIDLRKCGCM